MAESPGGQPLARAATARIPATEVAPSRTSEMPASGQPAEDRIPGLRSTVLLGGILVLLFFGGLMGWAAFAPLGSAAIASGTVMVDSNRRTIKHLEGGIVGEILVRDGDSVSVGQTLIRLDDTQAKANEDLLRGRLISALTLRARLEAERDGSGFVYSPDEVISAPGKDLRDMMDAQMRIFAARRESIEGQSAILEQQTRQFDEEIAGLRSEIASQTRQLQLIDQEIADLSGLVAKGLAQKPRLLALQREQAEIEGRRSQNRAAIARAEQSIGEARLRITELRTGMTSEVVQELREVQAEIYDINERMRAAEDVMRRTDIVSPIDGVVVGLAVHTRGGVIAPGEPLLDIVPRDDRLIVEAKIDPSDIDVVHAGLEAQVRLTSFKQRNLAPLDGRVTKVSADSFADERSGLSYYLARIEITSDIAEALGGAELYPGMPAEVMISTGERTALDYFLKPIQSSMNRAMRED